MAAVFKRVLLAVVVVAVFTWSFVFARETIRVNAPSPPKLFIADLGINDENGDGRIEPMENVEVTVRVQNIGYGGARNVTAVIQAGPGVFISGGSITTFGLGDIPPGGHRNITFYLYTDGRIKSGYKIPITIQIQEARPRYNVSRELNLAMNVPQRILKGVNTREDTAKKRWERPGRETPATPVDVDINIPEGRKAGKYDIAVIVGNRNYATTGITDVEYADRDARVMKEYLIKTFGYDPGNIIYAEDATLAKFNEIFGSEWDRRGRLFGYVKPDVSSVFIYYTGHGAPGIDTEEVFFVPVDADPRNIGVNGYRLQTFYDHLSKLPAKKIIVVIDACFSGRTGKGSFFKDISPAVVKVKKGHQRPRNVVLFAGAAVDQVSAWYPEKRHSLFTYYFLKGIQGEADTNKDRRVTLGEMKAYLEEHVPYMARRLRGIEQRPVILGSEDEVIVRFR